MLDLEKSMSMNIRAHAALHKACENKFQLSASIPARPDHDHDHDLLIGDALLDHEHCIKELRTLRARLKAADALRDAVKAYLPWIPDLNRTELDRIAAQVHRAIEAYDK